MRCLGPDPDPEDRLLTGLCSQLVSGPALSSSPFPILSHLLFHLGPCLAFGALEERVNHHVLVHVVRPLHRVLRDTSETTVRDAMFTAFKYLYTKNSTVRTYRVAIAELYST